MPVQKELINGNKKRTGAASWVENAQFSDLGWRAALDQLSDGMLDDVIDNVRWCVVDASGFFDFGLVFNYRPMPGREPITLPRNCS